MSKIIRADEASSQAPSKAVLLDLSDLAAQARQVVLDARQEAAAILADANAKAQQKFQQAADRGYEEGLAKGTKQGYEDGGREALQQAGAAMAASLSQTAQLARQIVDALADQREELLEQSARGMLDLAIAMARKIVGTVAGGGIEAARFNLAKVLEAAGAAGEITVAVNPGQLGQLQKYCRELLSILGMHGQVKLVGDQCVAKGGVKLFTRSGQIDATIETQFANVAGLLTGQSQYVGGAAAAPLGGPVDCPREKVSSQELAAADSQYIADGAGATIGQCGTKIK